MWNWGGEVGEFGDQPGFGFGDEPDAALVVVAVEFGVAAGHLGFADAAEAVERGERGDAAAGDGLADGGEDFGAVVEVLGGTGDEPDGVRAGLLETSDGGEDFILAVEQIAVDMLLGGDPTAGQFGVAEDFVMGALEGVREERPEVGGEFRGEARGRGEVELLEAGVFSQAPADKSWLHVAPPEGAVFGVVVLEMDRVAFAATGEDGFGWGACDVVVPVSEPIVVFRRGVFLEGLEGEEDGLTHGDFEIPVAVVVLEGFGGAAEEVGGFTSDEFGEDAGGGFGEVTGREEVGCDGTAGHEDAAADGPELCQGGEADGVDCQLTQRAGHVGPLCRRFGWGGASKCRDKGRTPPPSSGRRNPV